MLMHTHAEVADSPPEDKKPGNTLMISSIFSAYISDVGYLSN